VNSCVSLTKTTSVCFWFDDSFLAAISLEFSAERFQAACDRETLINEWDAGGTKISEGVHSLGWPCQEKESWWKIGVVVGEYQLG
jgi:hypothetical protein